MVFDLVVDTGQNAERPRVGVEYLPGFVRKKPDAPALIKNVYVEARGDGLAGFTGIAEFLIDILERPLTSRTLLPYPDGPLHLLFILKKRKN